MKYLLTLYFIAYSMLIYAQDITIFPYETGFEGLEGNLNDNYPDGWTSEDLNITQFGNQGWQIIKNSEFATNANTDSTALHMFSHSSETNDDWLFTPSIQMEAGNTYKLRFWTKVIRIGSTFERLKIHVATENNASAMLLTDDIWGNYYFINEEYLGHEVYFTPTETDIYYFGFHYFSDQLEYILLIDDVRIEEEITLNTVISSQISFNLANPMNETLQLELTEPLKENAILNLYNLHGKSLFSKNIESAITLIQENISQLPKGLYLLELTSVEGERLIHEKIIK